MNWFILMRSHADFGKAQGSDRTRVVKRIPGNRGTTLDWEHETPEQDPLIIGLEETQSYWITYEA
jgi:hypothetical protein